jgi:hypothetical protein
MEGTIFVRMESGSSMDGWETIKVCLYRKWEMTEPNWKTFHRLFRQSDSNPLLSISPIYH